MESAISQRCSKEKGGTRKNIMTPILEVAIDTSLILLRWTKLFLEHVLKYIQELDVKMDNILMDR